MNNKIITGILEKDSYNEKGSFLSLLSKNGFYRHSISYKIKEMAKYLLKANQISDIDKNEIDKIRKKGYTINKLYWLNLLLTSVSEKEDRIVIDDLWEEDLYGEYVIPIVSDSILVPNIKFFKFPGESTEIKKWIKNVEKMYNTK